MENIEKKLKAAKKAVVRSIILLIVSISVYVIAYIFYGWKLSVILFLFEWSRNLWVKNELTKKELDIE